MKFIDLAFLLVIIPWRMTTSAQSQNRSAVLWVAMGVVAWIVTSLLVAVSYAFVQSYGALHLKWTADTLRSGVFMARVLGIVTSMAVVEALRQRLLKMNRREKRA